MTRTALLALAGCAVLAITLVGCNDTTTAPHLPPAAPRGVVAVNGDRQVTLYWYFNTEPDVVQYRIYQGPCSSGINCPYTRVATVPATQDSVVIASLSNGVVQYFAVSAVDAAGLESDLSYEDVFETPRPAGVGATIANFRGGNHANAGWDFAAAMPVSFTSPQADIVYSDTLGFAEVYAADSLTNIQDAGWTSTLDDIAWAPSAGWSPTGSVEVIPGHAYVVWTRDNHFAKFRVTSWTQTALTFDWAYQTVAGNMQLHAKPAHGHLAANALQAPVTQR